MKIKPTIRGPKNHCKFDKLDIGDTFIYHNQLWMKVEDAHDYEQMAVNLTTGDWECDLCGTTILPVDAVVTWTKQKE